MTALEKPGLQLLEKYCFDCHSDGIDKGNFEFDKLSKLDPKSAASKDTWHKVWDVIEEHQMPPANKKKQPTQQEREQMMIALEQKIFSIERSQKYAGEIELVRMSNEQYINTMKDFTGTWANLSNRMPLDPTSGSFNNVSSTLNIPPLLFEIYAKLADEISEAMFSESSKDKGAKARGKQILKITGDGKDIKKTTQALRRLSLQAYRRIPTVPEVQSIKKVYLNRKKITNHKDAMRECVKSLLISPNFLFRTELFGIKNTEGRLAKIDEFALASRLAFFLWNSAPDMQLLNTAHDNKLRKNLDKEVQRLIKNKRFKNSISSFGQHWLGIQYLQNNLPSRRIIKNFEQAHLRQMQRETDEFLTYIFQNNKPINEIFSSQETFVDKRLASLYGVPAPKVKYGFGKVTMPAKSNRRGILTMPSVLIVTSDPNRTSPVKRGTWILENLLGMPPPPAPADVDVSDFNKRKPGEKKLTFRQKLEKHRDNKACASCHDMMDPLGFAMENFDAVGRWRTQDKGKAIDSTTEWRGHKINKFDDLYQLMIGEYRTEFINCFTDKLMSYALGRGLEIQDRITTQRIVEKVDKPDGRFHDVFMALIQSTPFQYRLLPQETTAK